MAAAFAAHGLDVALIDAEDPERKASSGFDGRAYAVAEGSKNLLSALGIWDDVEMEAQPIRRISVSDGVPDGAAMLHFSPGELGEEALGWIVEDATLRRLLAERATALGVRRIAPASAQRVEREILGATVTLNGHAPLAAELVVACDGRLSPTAKAAGIRYIGWPYRQSGLVTVIEHEKPHEGVAHQSFFSGGPFAVLPLRGNRSSLVWSEKRDRAAVLHALPADALAHEITARIGDRLGAISVTGRRWLYPLGLALAADYVRPRLAVAGDSAHGVHPIAGQGMNMGLRDVAALTEVVVQARRRGEDIGQTTTLDQYERWRRFDATAMSLGMDAVNRGFSNDNAILRVLRGAALDVASHLPALRRALMAEASGQSGDIPRLLSGRLV